MFSPKYRMHREHVWLTLGLTAFPVKTGEGVLAELIIITRMTRGGAAGRRHLGSMIVGFVLCSFSSVHRLQSLKLVFRQFHLVQGSESVPITSPKHKPNPNNISNRPRHTHNLHQTDICDFASSDMVQ